MADHMVIDEDSGNRGSFNGRLNNRHMKDSSFEPVRSEEGWVVIVRGIHEEADEEALTEKFSDFGVIKDVHFNLDRRTGYVKGYALIKYETRREAQLAVDEANGTKFLGRDIQVDFAFGKGPEDDNRNHRRSDRRSVSPS